MECGNKLKNGTCGLSREKMKFNFLTRDEFCSMCQGKDDYLLKFIHNTLWSKLSIFHKGISEQYLYPILECLKHNFGDKEVYNYIDYARGKDYLTVDQVDKVCEKLGLNSPLFPSLAQEAKNLLGDAKENIKSILLKGEKLKVSDEETERRLAICRACEYYVQERCRVCGCYMSVKSRLRASTCRMKKWDAVTAIILVGEYENAELVNQTIESLVGNSEGSLHITLVLDGYPEEQLSKTTQSHPKVPIKVLRGPGRLGERKALNWGVRECQTPYFLRLDAHCTMSKGWDTALRSALKGPNDIAFSVIQAMKPTGELLPGKYTFVYMLPKAEEKWWGKPGDPTKEIEESPTLTGCGWMMRTDSFLRAGGVNEDLAKWGSIGPEVSLLAWRSGGKTNLHKGVVCGHVFQTNKKGYPVTELEATRSSLVKEYAKEIQEIIAYFGPQL